MTPKEAISKLVKVYMEEESLKETIKDLKQDIKESGLNPVVLSTVAKSVVANKIEDLVEKSEETLAAIEVSRS